MILLVFSVYDTKAELFAKPFFEVTKGTAVRAFSDAVNEEATAFHSHAEDYTLFQVGVFDDGTGVFEMFAAPVSMGAAVTFLISED